MLENLSYKVFEVESPKASVVVVHGMQEHYKRYVEFASYLKDKGYAVFLYDLPGHGDSGSKEDRGYFGEEDGFNNLVLSSLEIVNLAKKTYPNVPVVYFGHSMGTMIGRCFLQNYDALVSAMILSGPPAYVSAAPFGRTIASTVASIKGKKAITPFLTTLAVGGFSKAVKNARTPLDWLSVNEDNVDAYIKDEDCGFHFTNQGYRDLFDGMVRMNNASLYRMHNKDLPIYIFAGEEDPCIGGHKGFESSIALLEKVGYTHIDRKLYEGLRHETLNEKCKEEVFEDVVKWIEENVG